MASGQNQQKMQKRMLALGDSYTIGESVLEKDRWPNQLIDLLNAKGSNFSNPEIIAKTGWTTGELSEAIKESNPQGTFDLVSLLIGVNNQYRGNSLAEYKIEFRDLLNKAVNFADRKKKMVVVVSVPDWGVTPFAVGRDRSKISEEIDFFNAANRVIAEEMGVLYVEITEESRSAATDSSLIAEDGLHPSAKMYAQWALAVLKVLQ